jgi:outer membrane protein assembly factor BamD
MLVAEIGYLTAHSPVGKQQKGRFTYQECTKVKNLLLGILAALTAMLLAGCPALWNAKVEDKPAGAEELFKAAEERFEKKDYANAVEHFERLKSAYPDFQKIPEVHLKIADSLYNQGTYDKANARYIEFLELYPNHKDVTRAKYQIAMGYFHQIKNMDLDNRTVQRAAQAFKLVADMPDAGEWGKKAEEKRNECLKRLAEKELYKARTYVSMYKYNAARLAAKRILEEYPKLGYDEEASNLIKKIKDKKDK